MSQGGKIRKTGPSERHPILFTVPLAVLETALTHFCNTPLTLIYLIRCSNIIEGLPISGSEKFSKIEGQKVLQ